MKAGLCLSGSWALIFGLLMGCQASVNADAKVNGKGASADGDADVEFKGSGSEGAGEMTRASGSQTSGNTAGSALVGASSQALLGARHDLRLRAGKATASCQCLSVALGTAHHEALEWSAVPPQLDETLQLTVALSSEGQDCKGEPKESLGASYMGYRISGNDVVVLVEAAHGGRPLTNGAIIPKPVGTGQVYVAPASKKLPYGQALSGTGLCKIGNPGAPRSAAFSELELGTNAPLTTTDAAQKRAKPANDDDRPTTIDLSN